MTVSATIPIEHMGDANAELIDLGHGPCFSVPLRDGQGAIVPGVEARVGRRLLAVTTSAAPLISRRMSQSRRWSGVTDYLGNLAGITL